MELNQVIEYLIDNKYLINRGGKYLLTTSFQKDAVKTDKPTTAVTVQPKNSLASLKTKADWTNAYIQFIDLCGVPSIGYSKSGSYAMNKFSEAALKVFKNALEKEEINPEILILAVRLYYKSDIGYKKSISNYMTSGEWRTDYFKIVNSKDKKQLNEHIEGQRKESGGNFRLG